MECLNSVNETRICPTCEMERPLKEIVLAGNNLYQCKICMMLNKKPKAGKVLTKEEHEKRKLQRQKKVETPVVKKERKTAFCPGCLKALALAEFKIGKTVFRFCHKCREDEINLQDERTKRILAGGILSSVSFRLAKCLRCGHIGDITKDFELDDKSPTGYNPYCKAKCSGRRG